MTSPTELPEGTVTVLFTDIVGSTELVNTIGDDDARELTRDIEKLVGVQVEANRGVEIKGLGDGLMAAFQSARRAVNCARAIQGAVAQRNRGSAGVEIALRIGMHTGEVITEEGDLHGVTVAAAKRVEEAASASSIFISELTRGVLSGSNFEVIDRGEFDLKGFAQPWRLFEVPWEAEAISSVLGANEPTPLVGRDEELTALREALRQAGDGSGALIFLSGEPGIGKTRLCHEVQGEAEELGFVVRFGHCFEGEGSQPYEPLVEIFERALATREPDVLLELLGDEAPEITKIVPELRRRFPDIPAPAVLPKEQERRYLFNSIRAVLTRASDRTPQLLVFEDLHWADEATLAYLKNLAQWLGTMRVLVVGTYRDVELDARRPLAATLRELRRRHEAQRIDLLPLGENGVREILRRRSGQEPPENFVATAYRETQGVPYFVEEVFQHLLERGSLLDEEGQWLSVTEIGEGVPESIRLVISERLERLSADCQRLLTEAAVVGRRFRLGLVQELTSLVSADLLDALDEAEAAHLIRDASEGREVAYEFVHEQIRHTLAEGISVPRRLRLHQLIADAMDAGGEVTDESVQELAQHLFKAGASDPERTATMLIRAGDAALAADGFEGALRSYEQALSLDAELTPTVTGRLSESRARCLMSLGRTAEAFGLARRCGD